MKVLEILGFTLPWKTGFGLQPRNGQPSNPNTELRTVPLLTYLNHPADRHHLQYRANLP